MGRKDTGFTRRREFLLCAGMHGCALDTRRVHHERAYCPAFIETYEVVAWEEEIRAVWRQVALYSSMRGENRFRILAGVCEMLAEQGVPLGDLSQLNAWVYGGSELTHGALAARVRRGAGPELARVLAWSRAVNSRLSVLPREGAMFPHTEACLRAARPVADVAVIGTGTAAAVNAVARQSGLTALASVLCAQPGNWGEAVARVCSAGYLGTHMLFVGDTLDEARLARACGALFYPILPSREGACWQRLCEEAFPKFLHGSYAGAYEDMLLKAQRSFFR